MGIDLPFDAGNGTHELFQPFGGQILPLHRNDNAVRRGQCVDGQHSQRGHTVDDGVVIGRCHRGQILPQHRFPAHDVYQRHLQSRQLNVGGDKINPGRMVQNPLAGCDGFLVDGLCHQVGQCGRKLVRLPPAQHLGEIALGVGVHQQDFLALLGKADTQAGSCGGFPYAALLICQCDGFQKHTSISCNKKRAFRLLL